MQKSARIMGLEGFMCFEASLPGLRKQRGGWGGRSPPHYDTLFHYIISLYFVLIYTHTYIICYVMFSYRTKYTIMTKKQ